MEFTIKERYGSHFIKVDKAKDVEPEEAVQMIMKFVKGMSEQIFDEDGGIL